METSPARALEHRRKKIQFETLLRALSPVALSPMLGSQYWMPWRGQRRHGLPSFGQFAHAVAAVVRAVPNAICMVPVLPPTYIKVLQASHYLGIGSNDWLVEKQPCVWMSLLDVADRSWFSCLRASLCDNRSICVGLCL